MGIADNSSGAYAQGEKVVVQVASLIDILSVSGLGVALLKLNVEGMEYPLLETVLNFDMIDQINALQVQFHWNAPAAVERFAAIARRMADTHRLAREPDKNWYIWVKI